MATNVDFGRFKKSDISLNSLQIILLFSSRFDLTLLKVTE